MQSLKTLFLLSFMYSKASSTNILLVFITCTTDDDDDDEYNFGAKQLARTTASSKEAEPPCARNGPIACIASPATVTVPLRNLVGVPSKPHGARYLTVSVRCKEVGSLLLIISTTSAGKPFRVLTVDCLISMRLSLRFTLESSSVVL
ncbi:LOW QUALITY PROTEIN: hypothetical protein PanWU01x14_142490 [Parasponia andersonii]|uniref:Secreted protein n=1 Tax=Parasponia andersonii TaxID=3476 RepID=A0A2P5CLB7_PARAD|nr:LOW QUALITY PROTEIN: hypothetical protein PanWU01x14_142490 [Parasponia andersonii]